METIGRRIVGFAARLGGAIRGAGSFALCVAAGLGTVGLGSAGLGTVGLGSVGLGTVGLGAAALCSSASLCGCSGKKAEAPNFPNAPIVLISMDTVRADAVTGYGAPENATPTLRELGHESVLFETAVATTHHTAPSHATILTGFSPDVLRTPNCGNDRVFPMPGSIPTLAENLKSHGYATAAFLDGGNLLRAGGFDRGFDEFQSATGGIMAKEEAIRAFLESHKSKPFFLFVHTYRAHQPYQAPMDLMPGLVQGYQGKLLGAGVHSASLSRKEALANNYVVTNMNGDAVKNAGDRDFLHRIYNAGVTGADREVGSFLGLLRAAGVYDRCVLVVTADHGEAFGEHGFFDHKDVFEENVRVPLWIRLPGAKEGGRRVAGAFSQLHLAPTALGLLGIDPKVKPEGKNLAAALAGEPLPSDPVFSSWFLFERYPLGFAVRSGNHKYIDLVENKQWPKFFEEKIKTPYLFDLAKDPKERHNLLAENAAEAKNLRDALAAERQQWQAIRRLMNVQDGDAVEIDAESVKQLRAIGYNR